MLRRRKNDERHYFSRRFRHTPVPFNKVITEVNPDAVIRCAAWTAVDMAEDDDKVAKVRAINAGGTQNIADVCKKLDCKMTYISTDYVFDGQGTEPWQPDCKDYKPLNVYGQTKLEGELAVSQTLEKYFIVRIAWVFGLNGKNFIKTILFRTLLNRNLWLNPLSNVMGGWGIWETVNGEQKLITECIENVIMMVPFTSMVIWTFQEKVASSWKKILWYSGKIAFIFSISIEMLQLFLRLGTFQLSDLFYNTVGGVLGGLIYYGIMKVRKHP